MVSAHREEDVDAAQRIAILAKVLNGVAQRFDQPVVMSTHPRTRKRLEEFDIKLDDRIRLLPLGLPDYVQSQRLSHAELSDSGTITEESNILGFPSLNIRDAHERPEGMEEGAVVMTGLSLERVLQGPSLLDAPQPDTPISRPVADYDIDNVSDKVVHIIHSYTDFINRTVWQKQLAD